MKNQKGFTLLELLAAGVLVVVFSSVILPAYTSYRMQSVIPEGLAVLETAGTDLAQSKQAKGAYGFSGCKTSFPEMNNFEFSCQLNRGGQGYVAKAVGTDDLKGYEYTLDDLGQRRTVRHPDGAPAQACWSIRGTACDYKPTVSR